MKQYRVVFAMLLSVLLSACTTPSVKVSKGWDIQSSFIFDSAGFKNCHASTIEETPNGLVAAWFGGTEEKNPDVEIYLSKFIDGKWTAPITVANGIQNDTLRYPCWNPVLFQVPSGPLMLYYKVGRDPVDWWGEYKVSNDDGNTWSEAVRLPDGILGPVKNKPVLLSDGRLLSASSTEHPTDGRWQVHLEVSADSGKTFMKTAPLNDGIKYHIIQPSILLYGEDTLQLLCRSMENRLVTLWSYDKGQSWTSPDSTSVPNNNSGTDAVTLKDGRQFLVYNPTTRYEGKWGGPRYPISIAISNNGRDWEKLTDLDTEEGEYSYPAVIQAKDGSIHITYTWKREKIKHVIIKEKP